MVPQGMVDLWGSERGVFSILLLVIVSVLLVIAKVTPEQWLDYTKWLFGFLVAGKSLTTAVSTWKGTPNPNGNGASSSASSSPTPPTPPAS